MRGIVVGGRAQRSRDCEGFGIDKAAPAGGLGLLKRKSRETIRRESAQAISMGIPLRQALGEIVHIGMWIAVLPRQEIARALMRKFLCESSIFADKRPEYRVDSRFLVITQWSFS